MSIRIRVYPQQSFGFGATNFGSAFSGIRRQRARLARQQAMIANQQANLLQQRLRYDSLRLSGMSYPSFGAASLGTPYAYPTATAFRPAFVSPFQMSVTNQVLGGFPSPFAPAFAPAFGAGLLGREFGC